MNSGHDDMERVLRLKSVPCLAEREGSCMKLGPAGSRDTVSCAVSPPSSRHQWTKGNWRMCEILEFLAQVKLHRRSRCCTRRYQGPLVRTPRSMCGQRSGRRLLQRQRLSGSISLCAGRSRSRFGDQTRNGRSATESSTVAATAASTSC